MNLNGFISKRFSKDHHALRLHQKLTHFHEARDRSMRGRRGKRKWLGSAQTNKNSSNLNRYYLIKTIASNNDTLKDNQILTLTRFVTALDTAWTGRLKSGISWPASPSSWMITNRETYKLKDKNETLLMTEFDKKIYCQFSKALIEFLIWVGGRVCFCM